MNIDTRYLDRLPFSDEQAGTHGRCELCGDPFNTEGDDQAEVVDIRTDEVLIIHHNCYDSRIHQIA